MEFKIFTRKLKKIIGGGNNNASFMKTIFELMMNDSGPALLEHYSPDTFRSFFNGHVSISQISAIVLANLNDEDEFSAYIDDFGDTAAQMLADEFKDDIPGINAANASNMIKELLLEFLRESSEKEKSTTKNAAKTPHEILEEKILASGQALANSLGNTLKNTATRVNGENGGGTTLTLPDEHPSEYYPYQPEDKMLLQEFTADYDDIMFTLIGEGYADALIDMSLPNKIKSLYSSKWASKADDFIDLKLKSYVFGLLGELNTLTDNFFSNDTHASSIQSIRVKIRNLYVRLHPESFSSAFPYDAFIDDWNDEEL